MLSTELRKLVEEVNNLHSQRKRAVQALHSSAMGLNAFDALESGLRLPVAAATPNAKIAAVDGGLLAQEFHGIDLFLARACGVCFAYYNGIVREYDYHPSPLPAYSVRYSEALQRHEFSWYSSLVRLESELTCAVAAAKKFSPRMLLLDGSIVPQVGDRPSRESLVYEDYERVLEKFKELYALSREKGFWLAGVIKDSRGRHFLDLLIKSAGGDLLEFSKALQKTNDTTFLYVFLSPNERTPAFKYSSAASEHFVLRDLGEWSKKIASFYVKPVAFDRPLRVDFLLPDEASEISEIASLVNALSQGNREYAYPAVLIEADLRAALGPSELEFVSSALLTHLGRAPDLLALRRNSRPFR